MPLTQTGCVAITPLSSLWGQRSSCIWINWTQLTKGTTWGNGPTNVTSWCWKVQSSFVNGMINASSFLVYSTTIRGFSTLWLTLWQLIAHWSTVDTVSTFFCLMFLVHMTSRVQDVGNIEFAVCLVLTHSISAFVPQTRECRAKRIGWNSPASMEQFEAKSWNVSRNTQRGMWRDQPGQGTWPTKDCQQKVHFLRAWCEQRWGFAWRHVTQ